MVAPDFGYGCSGLGINRWHCYSMPGCGTELIVDRILPMAEIDMARVLEELAAREPIFHRPEFGTRREDFDGMMDPAFREIGASGRGYSREFVLDELERRHAKEYSDVWEASDFGCLQIGDGLYLLTYTLLQDRVRLTRRTTIWRRTDAGWKIVFHQGTVVEG